MTDLNKERELYESVIEKTQGIKMKHLVGISFNAESNQYEISGEKWACELTDACEELNTGWFIWQECVKAKAQVVPEGYTLINNESLLFHAQSIRMFNDGDWENHYEEIEEHVCSIEEMVEASKSGAEG